MNTLLTIILLRDVPFWMARRWLRRVVALVYLYLAILVALLALENLLLFPGATFGGPWREPPAELDVQTVQLPIAGGGVVHGWFIIPPDWKPHTGAVLYSHGNGRNLSYRGRLLGLWRRHLNRAVLVYDYPGYGNSPGRPTEENTYAAGDSAYDWLVQEKKVPRGEIVLVGESLGGAIAIDLAVRREHRMLITMGTFTSFPDMASVKFPWLPGRWFVRNQYDSLSKIPRVRAPVLIAHGTADAMIPLSQGERLAAAVPEPTRFVPLEGLPHIHPDSPEFWQAVMGFLSETRR